MVDFGEVLTELWNGCRAWRAGWNGDGMWIALQMPNGWSDMQRPYLYMSPVDGELVPWVASQSDLLASDWHTEPF